MDLNRIYNNKKEDLMMRKTGVCELQSFADKTQTEAHFSRNFKGCAKVIEQLNKTRILELQAAGKNQTMISEITKRYNKILASYADAILQEDVAMRGTGRKEVVDFKVPLTEKLKEILIDKKDALIEEGFIGVIKTPLVSVLSGKTMLPGELFLKLEDGSADAIALSECTESNYIGTNVLICCLV